MLYKIEIIVTTFEVLQIKESSWAYYIAVSMEMIASDMFRLESWNSSNLHPY